MVRMACGAAGLPIRNGWARAACGLLALLLASAPASARAYNTNDPKVQEMLKRAVAYLELDHSGQHHADSLGGSCLIAQAIFKHTKNRQHPKVLKAIEDCRKASLGQGGFALENYNLGFAINFLASLEDEGVRPIAAQLYQRLLRAQRADGAWSYSGYRTGDTSQTQYAVLSTWAVQAGEIAQVPQESIEAVCDWLVRTQDPSGAWGYQGKDPGIGNYARQGQQRMTHSIVAAGLGSLYILADMLGMSQATPEDDPTGLDPAFQSTNRAPRGGGGGRSVATRIVDPARVTQALADGDRWFASKFSIPTDRWQYYYMYGLERYMTFRAKVQGVKEDMEKGPSWYNQGVDFLIRNQKTDGSWQSKEQAGAAIDTAFAVLFLVRSTRSQVHSEMDGILVAGRGLPTKLRNIRLDEEGKIVAPEITGAIDDLIKMLNEDSNLDVGSVDLSNVQLPKKVPTKSELDLLKETVSKGSYQQRLFAVRTLARKRENMESVPVLIYALSDPDWRVVKEARDGLRLISRRLTGFDLPDQPTNQQKKAAQADWTRWYRSIRPDAQLE